FVLMFEALRLTDAVSVAAIFTLIPLMSAGFGWLLLGQRTSPGALLALVIGGAGAVWVVFRADPAAILAFDLGPGEWLFVLGCASHALYTPVLRKLSRGEPALVFAFGVLLGGFATTLLWGGRTAVAADWGAVPGFVWGTILYLGLVATAVTFLLMRYATLRLPAGKVMAYGYLVPAFVIVWEGLVAGEWVAAPVWLGVGATLAALLVLLHEVD
ncbi:MAG: DMT family transporter, partial [Pseudomonadota bacterium]